MTDQVRTPESQPSEAVLMSEVRYGIVFAEMNELFYGRIHRILLAITIFAALLTVSSGAGALLVAEAAKLGLGATLKAITVAALLAGLASEAIRRAFHFDKREAAFREAKKAFQDLEGKGWSMAQGTLLKEVAKLRKNAPSGGEWLASPAFNRACEELGYPERHRPVPPVAQFLQHALAG